MAEEEGQVPNTADTGELTDGVEAAPAEQTASPATFLTNLSERLKSTDGVDVEVAGILIEHLLMVTPKDNAVANANAAILDLARERAARATAEKQEAVDG
jgi:hypothetical protein